MHLLATTTASLDEIATPVDLRQPAGDIAVLSFADSDLAGLAAAFALERGAPIDPNVASPQVMSLRIAGLRELRHPMSVDLWIERVGARAKVILVRLLGGADWWRYGVDRLAALARANGIKLALLPGEDRDDPRLVEASTLPPAELARLLAYFREGGRDNMRSLLRRLAFLAGAPLEAPEPQPLPRQAGYLPGEGAVSLERLVRSVAASREGEAAFEQRSFECDGDAAAALHLPLEGGGRPLQRPGGGDSRVANEAQHARHRFYPTPDRPAPHREGATGTPPGRSDPPPSGEGVTALDGQPPSAGEAEAALHQRSAARDGGTAAALYLPLEGGGRPLQRPGGGDSSATDEAQQARHCARSVVLVIFYRALLLAGDTAVIDMLCDALKARGLIPAPLVVTSLKEPSAAEFVRDAIERLMPAIIVTATAFAACSNTGQSSVFDAADVPVLQVVIANTTRTAWRDSPRGLGAADLAMHVMLPEIDGRVLAGAVAFKDALPANEALAFTALSNRPEPDRIEAVAERVAGLVRLAATSLSERRVAILMPDYPAANRANGSDRVSGAPQRTRDTGRTGYAVGLDVPTSVTALLADLAEAGYTVEGRPSASRALLDAIDAGCGEASLGLDAYAALAAALPTPVLRQIQDAWGDAADDPDVRDGAFRFRAAWFGRTVVAVPPDRGRPAQRRVDYHDSARPPRHALAAFWLWLRHVAKVDAVVHMGAHGTLEWLPGKSVALTAACFPEALIGPLPVLYPFIVSNPGEAAQAKRRIAAVTISHLPPPLVDAELSGDARELERLVDEYAQADGLDRRRRERLAGLIVDCARRSGFAVEAGVAGDADPETALRRIDAWLCDLKDFSVKDGLHVYGRAPATGNADPLWPASVAAERAALLAGLDGRRVVPGPAGAPTRGRRDVLPTGRNLFATDPRMLPTATAMDLGWLAAEEVVRLYLQTHGEMPRALVIDLWGSATLRTGGEEIAQGLALMGCRPTWDATGRVTGIEVLPLAACGRPRIDVTWRISGLFRDLFPAQIALIDAATRAIAAREETDEENPLAAARRAAPHEPSTLARIFGTAPGAYGAGIEDILGHEAERDAIGAAYLAAASHAYGGADGAAAPSQGFAARVAAADLLVHPADDPGRDLLEGAEDAAFMGGFAAGAAAVAARASGRAVDLIVLDTSRPGRPRARPLADALARIVRARAINPRFIAGQMRHGPRGAAEFAETVTRLVDFAQTTGAVADTLIDLVYDAYLADPAVREFLLRENPGAARNIAESLAAAHRHGWWHPRRNDVDADLRTLMAEAGA